MHVLSVLAAGVLAAQASAFLIPLEISAAAEPPKKDLVQIFAETTQAVDLDCPGCPFAGAETASWENDVDNLIHLEFDASISSGLTINNATVLPSGFAQPAPITITAHQIRSQDGAETHSLPLDFAVERLEPLHDKHNTENMVIPVRFTIFAIGGQPIKVDTITIDLIQTEDVFIIGRIATIPFETTPGAETCSKSSRWSLCRFKAILAFRLQQMLTAARTHSKSWGPPKGCGGRKHGKHEQGRTGFWTQGEKPHHGHHEHVRHHPHTHGRLHRAGKMLHQTLRFFVIPAMLGVIGGLIASAVGMMVAQAIVYLWVNCYRKAWSPRQEQVEIVDVLIIDDEKKMSIADGPETEEEVLPRYTDIPPEYPGVDVEARGKEEQ